MHICIVDLSRIEKVVVIKMLLGFTSELPEFIYASNRGAVLMSWVWFKNFQGLACAELLLIYLW